MSEKIAQYWQGFLKASKRPLTTPYLESFYFGHTEELANELLALVLSGKKRATCSSRLVYESTGEPTPKVGDLSIVTDWTGEPFCVIETTAISQYKFSEMTFETCKREGEDDTLESWQAGHITFFKAEGKELGYEFDWEMPVIFEDFEVIYE